MKKTVSWIMVMIFLIGIIQFNVNAEEILANKYAFILSEVGIFKGSDKGFELDREPTRLEGLVMTLRMLGLEEEAINYDKKVVDFKDVPAWGERYVQYAYKLNLTKGISNEHFGSSNRMDNKSYLTFMLRSLGYDDDKKDFTWSNAAEKAAEIGIIKKNEKNTMNFTRGDIAEVSYNTLKMNLKGEDKLLIEKLVEEKKIDQTKFETLDIKIRENLISDDKALNVEDFGAIGNGVADDSTAIQNAINQASSLNKTLVFGENKTYRITKTLLIKSNLHISGYGSTIFMPSQSGLVNMMITDYGKFVENVTVEGVTFKSKNDRAGTGYATNSLTSNVTAMHFTGIKNLKVKDVDMHDMNVGIKFGVSSVNQINENITLDNTHIYSSLTPLLMNTTNGFTMTNGTLDASAGSSRYLHSVYVDKNTSNITFDNVLFENSPGAGVHLYNGYANTNVSTNIKILNSRIQDSRVGILLFSGANKITVSNVEIVRVDLAFSIDNVTEVNINNVKIMEPTAITDVPKGAFRIRNMYQSSIENVTIDGNGMEGILFNIYQNLVDVLISNITATDINDLHLFHADSTSNVKNLVVNNSTFEMKKVSTQRSRFLGKGSIALFENNTFVNTGVQFSSLFNIGTNTSISLNANKYSGFTKLTNSNNSLN